MSNRPTLPRELADKVATSEAGWGQPVARTHAHFFDAGQAMSVCGRVLHYGRRSATSGPHRGTACKLCKTRLEERNHG